jgi:flagellar biogenesis protein FliO
MNVPLANIKTVLVCVVETWLWYVVHGQRIQFLSEYEPEERVRQQQQQQPQCQDYTKRARERGGTPI